MARCHPDLTANYDKEASYDFSDLDHDPSPEGSFERHGTKEAARREEPVCTIGIAYQAHLGDIRILQQETITDTKEAQSLGYRRDYIDLYQIAWGPPDDGKTFRGPGLFTRQTLEDGDRRQRWSRVCVCCKYW